MVLTMVGDIVRTILPDKEVFIRYLERFNSNRNLSVGYGVLAGILRIEQDGIGELSFT